MVPTGTFLFQANSHDGAKEQNVYEPKQCLIRRCCWLVNMSFKKHSHLEHNFAFKHRSLFVQGARAKMGKHFEAVYLQDFTLLIANFSIIGKPHLYTFVTTLHFMYAKLFGAIIRK